MQGVPETVNLAQVQAAARALGLSLDALHGFSANMREVTAEVYVLGADGRKIRHGNHIVSTTLHLPIVTEGVPDAAAQQ